MAQLGVSFEPPTSDQHEEQARYECTQLVHHGHLDGGHLLSLRDAGVSWSVIRDEAIAEGAYAPSPEGCSVNSGWVRVRNGSS